LGYTEDGSGNNQLSDIASAVALSGSTLPQVSSGGTASGTYHVVTDDGYGPLSVVVDESATGKFSTAKTATVTTQVPGNNGNSPTKRSVLRRALVALGLISKRAENVNVDYVSLHLHISMASFSKYCVLIQPLFSPSLSSSAPTRPAPAL
jgi:hypothetical protein